MYFDERALGNESTRNKSFIRLLQPPSIIVSASGVSITTRFLSSNSKKHCGRLGLFLQKEQAGKNSKIFNDEIDAIVFKLLEYKSMSTKQQRFLLLERFA